MRHKIPNVLVSNGFNRFQLVVAAAEASRRGRLDRLVTGAYPTSRVRTLARPFLAAKAVDRLIARGEEVPTPRVVSLWAPELAYRLGRALSRASPEAREFATIATLRWYGRAASRVVSASTAAIYHYRSGFGYASAEAARSSGMRLLCDHSIANPAVLEHLIANRGQLPDFQISPASRFWAFVEADLQRADVLLVNSDFVRQTFVTQGWLPERVRVVYWGVDDAFLSLIPRRLLRSAPSGPLRLLFAGSLQQRKGLDVMTEALNQVEVPWTLRIAGSIDRALETKLLRNPRVEWVGAVSRKELARLMTEAEVFVFLSLAEGSARVVFEAMACGAPIITAPNTGSVVRDVENGWLVSPGAVQQVVAAIHAAYECREQLSEIGARNASLIRAEYTQTHYGDALARVYDELWAAAE